MYTATEENMQESPEAHLFRRFIRGELGLAKTFWLYNILVSLIIYAPIQWLIQKSIFTIQSTFAGTAIPIGFEILMLTYSVIATIALWRSANLYKGRRLWSRLTKGITVIGWIMLVLTYTLLLVADDENKLKRDMQILSLNQSLPVMIDSETRLDRISIEASDIVYSATLVNQTKDQVNRATFENQMFEQIKLNACHNTDTQKLFDNDYNMVYRYLDNNGIEVGEVKIKGLDCKGSLA